jgi:hypothetical protein
LVVAAFDAGQPAVVASTAAARLFDNQILDEASTGYDGGAEEARGVWVHVRAAAPAVVRSNQLEANFVFEHMRRRIDLDVHGPPQGDPHRRAHRCAPFRRAATFAIKARTTGAPGPTMA